MRVCACVLVDQIGLLVTHWSGLKGDRGALLVSTGLTLVYKCEACIQRFNKKQVEERADYKAMQ